MTCVDRELQIALNASGELSAVDIAELEAHLHGCARCRQVQVELAELHSGLAGLLEVDSSLAREARLGAMRLLRWRRASRWAALGAVAAALLLAIPIRTTMMIAPPPPAAPKVAYAVPDLTVRPIKPQVKRVIARRESKPKAEPMLVKIFTDDPDVVILWITD